MRWSKLFKLVVGLIIAVIFYCEYLVYFFVLVQCNWPTLSANNGHRNSTISPVSAMILADTHLLGPHQGHWLDKAYREWHMHRAFQTSVILFQPETVFILGDLFDEGQYVNRLEFRKYVQRFRKLFHTPQGTNVISVVGNHDVGFHYRMDTYYTKRFENEFNNTGVNLYTIKDVHFVVINSMAMENDKCYFCEIAQNDLKEIKKTFDCIKTPSKCKSPISSNMTFSRPILMQHFPTYRISDKLCDVHDSPKIERYRENYDVLSKESTDFLGKILHPRLALSGHSHHYCKLKNRLGIDEYTVASFNWRNKINPSFLLAQFTPDTHQVSKCDMPVQTTIFRIYICGLITCITIVIYNVRK